MNDADCLKLIKDAFLRISTLQHQRESIDLEMSKLEQFISATANLLPDPKQAEIMAKVELIQDVRKEREAGLTDAIKNILRKSPSHWHTATTVRDKLVAAGFDFSHYTANPLASVHAVLKRLKREDAECTTVDGSVMAWRWKANVADFLAILTGKLESK